MDIEPRHDFEAAQQAVRKWSQMAAPWSGEVYRSATPRYARAADIVTGLGSGKLGGRWNPPGGFATVYASLQPEAAMSESLAAFRYYGWALHDAMPRLFRSLAVSLVLVLDLRQPALAPELAGWMERIRHEDWRALQQAGREPASQMLGRAAFAAGLEGLLVPSFAAADTTNLVAFPGNFAAASSIRVIR